MGFIVREGRAGDMGGASKGKGGLNSWHKKDKKDEEEQRDKEKNKKYGRREKNNEEGPDRKAFKS